MSAIGSTLRAAFWRRSSVWFWTSPPPGAEWRHVRCAQCRRFLYSTNGIAVSTSRAGAPITVTLGNQCACFCARACVLEWFAALPSVELHAGGRRLW